MLRDGEAQVLPSSHDDDGRPSSVLFVFPGWAGFAEDLVDMSGRYIILHRLQTFGNGKLTHPCVSDDLCSEVSVLSIGSKVYTPVRRRGQSTSRLEACHLAVPLLTSSNAADDGQPERENFTGGAHSGRRRPGCAAG